MQTASGLKRPIDPHNPSCSLVAGPFQARKHGMPKLSMRTWVDTRTLRHHDNISRCLMRCLPCATSQVCQGQLVPLGLCGSFRLFLAADRRWPPWRWLNVEAASDLARCLWRLVAVLPPLIAPIQLLGS